MDHPFEIFHIGKHPDRYTPTKMQARCLEHARVNSLTPARLSELLRQIEPNAARGFDQQIAFGGLNEVAATIHAIGTLGVCGNLKCAEVWLASMGGQAWRDRDLSKLEVFDT
jgi:hypothetical protein